VKKLLVLTLVLAGLMSAQEASTKPKWQQKFVEVKSASVTRLTNLLQSIPGLRVQGDSEMRVISIGSDNPELIQTAEDIIKRFDRPSTSTGAFATHNFELTLYLMMAGKELKVGDALPAELEPVAKQLRSIFGFKDIQLFDTAFQRNRESNDGELSGNAEAGTAGASKATIYSFSYRNARVIKDERGYVLELGSVKFALRTPVSVDKDGHWQYTDVGFNTNLDIRDGQKVVVGKSRIGADDRSLIVVVTAKVVD